MQLEVLTAIVYVLSLCVFAGYPRGYREHWGVYAPAFLYFAWVMYETNCSIYTYTIATIALMTLILLCSHAYKRYERLVRKRANSPK